MKKLTIFTPTYNRAKILVKAYKSLIEQTNLDFVWLIVDDGSSDNTNEIIEEWKKENKIEIKYYKKENGGKHSAYNYGIDYVETEYVFISLDSDDILYDKYTIQNIINEISNISNNEFGIITLCTNSRDGNNSFVKKYNVGDLHNKSLKWAYTHNAVKAECRMILKTKYARTFKYPEIPKENFFTEAYVYYQMDKPVKWTSLNTCYSEYLDDGLTANIAKLFYKNPISWYLYNELRMKENHDILLKIKFIIYYIAFALMSKNKIFKKNNPNILLLLLLPMGFIGKIYLTIKGRKKI